MPNNLQSGERCYWCTIRVSERNGMCQRCWDLLTNFLRRDSLPTPPTPEVIAKLQAEVHKGL